MVELHIEVYNKLHYTHALDALVAYLSFTR